MKPIIISKELKKLSAISADDAAKILALVKPHVKKSEVTLDFEEIIIYAEPFLAGLFGVLFDEFGFKTMKKITLVGMRNTTNKFLTDYFEVWKRNAKHS